MVKADELTGLPFFQRLSLEELEELAKIIYEKLYASRMNVFEEGTQDPKMYVIKSGLVQIVLKKGEEEEIITTFTDGEFFGEMAIFDISPRSATARVAQDTSVLEISKEDFDKFLDEKPEIAAKILYGMMEEMVRRLRKTIKPEVSFLI